MLNVVSHVTCSTHHMISQQLTAKFSGEKIWFEILSLQNKRIIHLLSLLGSLAPSSPPPLPLTRPSPTLKLLYVVTMGTDHAPWSRDSAEPLPLSEEECLWLCMLLSESTRSMPPSHRSARGLNVSSCNSNIWRLCRKSSVTCSVSSVIVFML